MDNIDIKKYSYEEVALNQLETAIFLYLEGNYISAFTLAAPAEELLGAIAKEKTGTNSQKTIKEFSGKLYQYQNRPVPSDKEHHESYNYLKRAIKHKNDPAEKHFIEIVFDLQAKIFIINAMENYLRVHGTFPSGGWFDNYSDVVRK